MLPVVCRGGDDYAVVIACANIAGAVTSADDFLLLFLPQMMAITIQLHVFMLLPLLIIFVFHQLFCHLLMIMTLLMMQLFCSCIYCC